jgi:hypothetical protein
VFDTGSEDSVHYIVMERVDGRTLADILAAGGACPLGGPRRTPRRSQTRWRSPTRPAWCIATSSLATS